MPLEGETQDILRMFLEQQHHIKVLRANLSTENKKLKDCKAQLGEVLRTRGCSIPVTLNMGESDEAPKTKECEVKITECNTPEPITKTSLKRLLLQAFTEKFGQVQSEEAVAEAATWFSDFVWQKREKRCKSDVELIVPSK